MLFLHFDIITLDQDLSRFFLPYFLPEDIVVIAPLNWGLGHASRCIPLIRVLERHCRKVIIATDGAAKLLLTKEFPNLDMYELPDYGIQYKYGSIFLNILVSLPTIMRAVQKERILAKLIVKTSGATVILSDNRLGFRANGLRNFYLTHQINILHANKMIADIGSVIHHWFIKKFDLCFVPDYNGEKAICPALSHHQNLPLQYIGPLTRIKNLNLPKKYDICVLLSGTEPQRSRLEYLLLKELNTLEQFKILLIRGTDIGVNLKLIGRNITVNNLLTSSDIEIALNTSRLLISRSGYSTIMDIYGLEIKAIFIPTPGQTEQEYLAKKCDDHLKYFSINQNEIKKLNETIKYLI